MRPRLILLLPFALAGCLREPDPFEYVEPALSVHALLHASDTEVRVSVLPGVGEIGAAELRLDDGTRTIQLSPSANDSSCYAYAPTLPGEVTCYLAELPEPVQPGTRWLLSANVEPGHVVSGSTRVPEQPALLRPAARERVAYSGPGTQSVFTVEWRTEAAPRVEIRLGEGSAYRGGSRIEDARCMVFSQSLDAAVGQPAGSRTVAVQDVYCGSPTVSPVEWDSVAVPVVVTAFDSAYAAFALFGESMTRNRNGGLQGAYGVFGSAASASREVVITRP